MGWGGRLERISGQGSNRWGTQPWALSLPDKELCLRAMHETGHSGLVHWDDPEGWDGEGGGRGVQDGEHMYEKTREFQKNIYFCFIDYAKAFDCVDHNKL